MVAHMTRNFIGLLFWSIALIFALAVNIVIFISNYLGCQTAFELLGFEPRPLGVDKLVGAVFDVFVSGATLAHLYALGVAATVAMGLFVLFHLFFKSFELYQERQSCLSEADPEGARMAMKSIVHNSVIMLILAIPVVAAIRWDIELFRYRSVAFALGIEEAAIAPVQITIWGLQLEEHGDFYAWSLAGLGAWGYIGITAIACLGLEYAFGKVDGYLSQFFDTFGELIPAKEVSTFYEEDADGLPVTELDLLSEAGSLPTPRVSEQEQESPDVIGEDESEQEQGSPDVIGGEEGEHVREQESLDVIGGEEGERVSLAEAEAHPERYWIDPDTLEIWDLDFIKARQKEGAPPPNQNNGGR